MMSLLSVLITVLYIYKKHIVPCQDLLPAVSNPPPGKHPLQEEDLQGWFHRHLQPRGVAHRLRAAGGEQHVFTSIGSEY